jgi:hypothetical protein
VTAGLGHTEISLVTESNPAWLRKVLNLALSARITPGENAEVPIRAHVIGGAPSWVQACLRALNIEAVPADAIETRSPLNKIIMFRDADPARHLVALDCDLLLGPGFPGDLDGNRVAAVPASFPLLPGRIWRALFGALGLPLLDRPLTATISREPIPVPYLNSGVVLMPGRWGAELAEAWLYYARAVRRHPAIPRWTPVIEFHLDQIAFACAVSCLGYPLHILPTEYNAPFSHHEVDRVRVLHYHAQVNQDGTVRLRRPRPRPA